MSAGGSGGASGAREEEMEEEMEMEEDSRRTVTMEGGLGMLLGGTVLANGDCRLPGFQKHDTNFESESFNS